MVDHSVIIHSHNYAPFITACIDSVLAQTTPPDEIIVYDSGSTDGSLALLRRYGDRLQLIAGPSLDQPAYINEAHAVQTAFAQSHGRIIFLLDGDDRFKPGKIAHYRDAFEQHPDASVVQAPLERIDLRGASLGVLLEPRNHVTNHLREIYSRHDLNFFYPTSTLAFSRYYLERILPLDLNDQLSLWTDARLCIPAAYYGRIVTLLDPFTERRSYPNPDSARARSNTWQIGQLFMRARLFNTFCRRHHLRTITSWRNRRLYAHLLRHVMPPRLFDLCVRSFRPLLDWTG